MDPTPLTTDALHREVKLLGESIRNEMRYQGDLTTTRFEAVAGRFEAQEKAITAALVATDKAINKAEEVAEKAVLKAEENTARSIDKAEQSAERRYLSIEKEFHEHLEQARQENASALAASEKAIKAALESAEKAINKAEAATETRFQSVNEFRQTLSDQTSSFITRLEAEAAIGRNTERVQELTDRFNKLEGRGVGLNAGWIYILGAVAALGTIISFYLAFRPK